MLSAAAGEIRGVVVDASRTPVAGATVKATGTVGSPAVAHTDERGEWSLAVPAGAYRVEVVADGFQSAARNATVETGSPARVEFTLDVAGRHDMVTVNETTNYQAPVSSSTRTPTPLRDVPQSIAVVTSSFIRDNAMQNMADVVRYVPGITMAQGEGHRDAPVIRGNATTADFYVNGVRDDVQYFRDLYNVERVEAVKGANALTFGRGGGGGVINRVTKEAQFFPIREISLQGGTFGNRRLASDFGASLTDKLAFRVNGMYENTDSFRHDVNLERYGIAPTLTYKVGDRTQLRAGYEHFNDDRTVDRGIPSFAGRPVNVHRSTFFGNVRESYAAAGVNLGSVTLEHQMGGMNLRNATMIGDYDKFYQNVFPGAVNATANAVSISGYNNGTVRRNYFNQTDVSGVVSTGGIRHTLLMGTEVGRQRSDNFRQTGYFNGGNATSVNVPLLLPRTDAPVAWRQSATDADNFATNNIAAVYLQDQVELSRYIQVVGGLRYDYFDIDFRNRRNGEELGRNDHMVSPRAAIVLKPAAPLSFYGSYSVSYLPSSGDQFSSLTATSQTLKPEKFTNYEVGTKWDVTRTLALTGAVYRLDRTNTTARDPNNPAITVQTGSQRTKGLELSANGNITRKWRAVGGYSYQDAFISRATLAAALGAQVALVPNHTFSLWNNYSATSRLSMGLGVIHQAEMYTGVDNTVQLPEWTRVDAAAYYSLTEMFRLQANVENLLDRTYYATAHSNNNIMPGFARAVRVGLVARF